MRLQRENRGLWCLGNIVSKPRTLCNSFDLARSAYAYAVGSRVADAYALAPVPQSVVATVPAVRSYRYMVINNRLLLVDPATGTVVAEVTD